MFIAKDKNLVLKLFNEKPHREGNIWTVNGTWSEENDNVLRIYENLFPKLSWEDDPIEIGLLPVDLSYLEPMTSEQEYDCIINNMPFHCRVCSNASCLIPKGSDACEFYEEREKWYQTRK